MPEEKEPVMDMDFVILMALATGATAAITTTIALLARPIMMQLAQTLPLPQMSLPQLPMLPLIGGSLPLLPAVSP